jgi:hypothetical protein
VPRTGVHWRRSTAPYRCWRSLDRCLGTPPARYDISAAAAPHDLPGQDHTSEQVVHAIAAACPDHRRRSHMPARRRFRTFCCHNGPFQRVRPKW